MAVTLGLEIVKGEQSPDAIVGTLTVIGIVFLVIQSLAYLFAAARSPDFDRLKTSWLALLLLCGFGVLILPVLWRDFVFLPMKNAK
jgi:hypothetical protein